MEMTHDKRRKKARFYISLISVALTALFLASFCFGRYAIAFGDIIKILLSRLGLPLEKTWADTAATVVFNIRMPRIILACLVGCCLSAAGCAYQGVFQNPMAAPDILGASSGAAFGAALAILLGMGSVFITVSAFIFGLITVFAVYIIGRCAPGKKVVNLILAGVMISSLFTAATSYIKLVADPSNQLPAITYWLMGSLSGSRMSDIFLAALPMLAGLVPLYLLRWRINILSLGDDEARAMGINANRLRFIVILCSTLITAASVAVSGMIGWVGLIIPHLCRRLIGNDNRYLIPASMLFGALFLLAIDNISRNLAATEVPIGILTAFVGAPFFIYLIMRKGTTA